MKRMIKFALLGVAAISTTAVASPMAYSYGSSWGNATVNADDCPGPSFGHREVPWNPIQMIPCFAGGAL